MSRNPIRDLCAVLLVTLTLAACSDGGADDRCTPGITRECACAGGGHSAQSCNADGLSWSACACAPVADGGAPGDLTSPSRPSSPDAPRIISLAANLATVTPSKPLVVTAIVTDPQGIDDLIGGRLVNPSGGTYGAFATSSQEGSYSIKLTWADIHNSSAINAPPAGIKRVFRAVFYDQAGHEVSQDLQLTLACDDDVTACDGKCFDLLTASESCGKCGFDCTKQDPDTLEQSCVQGSCEVIVGYKVYDDALSCDDACTKNHHTCDRSTFARYQIGSKTYKDYATTCSRPLGDLKQDFSLTSYLTCYCKHLYSPP